jgi:glutamyl-tRNA reductase
MLWRIQKPHPGIHLTAVTTPTLFLVGATHRTAPFGFREKLALGSEAEAGFSRELADMASLPEVVILNTCNRVEIYGVAAEEGVPDRVCRAFCARQQVDPAEFLRFGFVSQGRDAIQHLLEVASGLDSQVVGETEIFGQVKRAYAAAQARGSTGAVLNRLFQKAFHSAKHVRAQTGITEGQVSIANIAVDLASDVFGCLADARVLLIGAGEMGEKSGRAFASRGVRKMAVSSRRIERAGKLASELGAGVLPFEEREAGLADWDIVVCSAAAPSAILSRGSVRAAMSGRSGRPILLVDLAMPRNVDAGVGDTGDVFLYNLDDLARISEKNRLARKEQAEHGRTVLAPRTEALWRQIQLALGDTAGISAAAGSSIRLQSAPAFA